MRYEHLGKEFNQTFSHHVAKVNNIDIHYVMGGSGKPLVLLHGYPQTWYAYRHLMPRLARDFTLIVPDLRGMGDSGVAENGYDTATVADDVFQLVCALGYERIMLLGHDFGASVAYAYAAAHRENVIKLMILDVGFLTSGVANSPLIPERGRSLWWFPFQMVPDLPELLVAGREAIYLKWFFDNGTFNKNAISPDDLREYVRCYSKPGGLTAAFSYYRALFDDMRFNEMQAAVKLKMPVLVLGGEFSFGSKIFASWNEAAEKVQGLVIADSGHYMLDEQPHLIVKALLQFLSTQED